MTRELVCTNETEVTACGVTLDSRNITVLVIAWNTCGFRFGNYTIGAYAEPVQGETFTSDNNLAHG